MPTLKQLEDQGRALLEDQKRLVEDESRPWSEKRPEYDKREEDIKAVLEQHRALKSVDGDPFAGAQVGSDQTPTETFTAKSAGEQLVDAMKTMADEVGPGKRFSAGVDVKATVTEAGGGAGTVIPFYQPGVIPTLFRRLTVADLLPQGSVSSPSIIYMQETGVTNAAATVAEGGAKPQSDVTIAQVTEHVRKIATSAKISDEMVNDVGYIQSYVNGRLVLFVRLAEEDQLLNGNGTAPNLTGILNRTGLQPAHAVDTVNAETRVDAIYKQITAVRTNAFLEPDALVVNPVDWQSIRLSKDSNGQYYGGGPFNFASYGARDVSAGNTDNLNAGSEHLWGLRVVVTPAIAAGTALVGAFGLAAQLYRREGIRVEATNSNENDFLNNLIAIRVEERLGLAVYRPGGFGTVTGL